MKLTTSRLGQSELEITRVGIGTAPIGSTPSWSVYWGPQRVKEAEETHLLIIESPYRSLRPPLLAYIDTVHELHPDDTLTVILPEFVVGHWWEYFLHNQMAFRLKAALLFRPGIVVTDVPQHLDDRPRQ